MTIPDQIAPAQAMTSWRGQAFTRYEVLIPTSGDKALVTVPDSVMEGTPIKLLMQLHGRGASHTFGYAGQKVKIAGEFMAAGYVVVSPDMHGQTWGNQRAVWDMLFLRSWVTSIWPIRQMYLFGESMGGNAAMNFVKRYPSMVDGVFMTSPSMNLQHVWDRGGTGHSDLESAFNLPPDGTGLQAVVNEWSAFHQPATSFTGPRVLAFSSEGDDLIQSAEDVAPMMAAIRAAGGDARHLRVGGGHVGPDHYRIQEMLAFGQESWGMVRGTPKRWDADRATWVPVAAPGRFYVGI